MGFVVDQSERATGAQADRLLFWPPVFSVVCWAFPAGRSLHRRGRQAPLMDTPVIPVAVFLRGDEALIPELGENILRREASLRKGNLLAD